MELLLVDVPRLKGTVTNSPGEDAVLAAEVINRRCLGFSYGSTSSALGMLSAEGGPKRKLTHHQATPFLILTCGVGFVTPRISTSWSSNSLRCSFPTYPLTAVAPTKIVSDRHGLWCYGHLFSEKEGPVSMVEMAQILAGFDSLNR